VVHDVKRCRSTTEAVAAAESRLLEQGRLKRVAIDRKWCAVGELSGGQLRCAWPQPHATPVEGHTPAGDMPWAGALPPTRAGSDMRSVEARAPHEGHGWGSSRCSTFNRRSKAAPHWPQSYS
jgi:hypothetical protein